MYVNEVTQPTTNNILEKEADAMSSHLIKNFGVFDRYEVFEMVKKRLALAHQEELKKADKEVRQKMEFINSAAELKF